jgi:hypothetical protein
MACSTLFRQLLDLQEPTTLCSIFKTPSGSFPEDVSIIEKLVMADCVGLSSILRERYGLSLELSVGVSISCAMAYRLMTGPNRGLFFDLYQARHPLAWHSSELSYRWSVLRTLGVHIDSDPLSVLCCL